MKDASYKQLIQCAAAFVLVSYTIGNMMPIPEGLNVPWGRGRDWIKKKVKLLRERFCEEYDKKESAKVENYIKHNISLGIQAKQLKETAKEIEKETREKIKKMEPVVGIISKWFKQEKIKSWKNFVEDNFLQDVFEKSEDCSYNKIREDIVVPPKNNENLTDWCNWFDTMTELIIRRGWRIMHEGDAIGEKLLSHILELLQIRKRR